MPQLIATLACLERGYPYILRAAALGGTVEDLVSRFERGLADENDHKEVKALRSNARQMRNDLEELRATLSCETYPFSYAIRETSIADYVIGEGVPPADAYFFLGVVSDRALENIQTVYFRTMAPIARLTEDVEKAFGLPPLPLPSKEEEEEIPAVA